LDTRARSINDSMKIAVSLSLAELAKEKVTPEVLKAYSLDHLEFGPGYIVPKPLDKRVCHWEAPAVAEAAMESGAPGINLTSNITAWIFPNALRNIQQAFQSNHSVFSCENRGFLS
jgi:malic enzyme